MSSIVEQFVHKGRQEGVEIGKKQEHEYNMSLFSNVLRLTKQGIEHNAIADTLHVPLEDVTEVANIIAAYT